MTSPFLAEILGPDLLVILAIVAVLFGSTRLPKLARSLGSAKSEFEKGLREGTSGTPAEGTAAPTAAAPTAAPAAQEAKATDEEGKVTMTRAELDALLAAQRKAPNGDQPN